MSFLQRIVRAFVPLRREDPRFGRMLYQRVRGEHAPGYWEGSGRFAGLEVEYFVDAGEEGPTAEQRARCDELERTWRAIEPRLARFLAGRAADDETGESSRDLADWSLGSIALPADGDARGVVEIGFVEKDGGELLTFEMDGHEPRGIRIGG